MDKALIKAGLQTLIRDPRSKDVFRRLSLLGLMLRGEGHGRRNPFFEAPAGRTFTCTISRKQAGRGWRRNHPVHKPGRRRGWRQQQAMAAMSPLSLRPLGYDLGLALAAAALAGRMLRFSGLRGLR